MMSPYSVNPLPNLLRTFAIWLAIIACASSLVVLISGCDPRDVPTCLDLKDPKCIEENFTPAEIRYTVKQYGSCYSFGRAICGKSRECLVHSYDRDTCIDWWIDNVCAVPASTNRMWHDHCARWATNLDCEYFIYGDDYYDGVPQFCEGMFPHPLMDQTPRVITESDIE